MELSEEWSSEQNQALQKIAKNLVPFSGLAVPVLERMKESKVVFLADSSHGTHEYYLWRAHVSEYLIRHHGFDFVAVEGEWPQCQHLTRYLQTGEGGSATEVLKSNFTYWPGWMWANEEIAGFVERIRKFNIETRSNVGLHGLDVYARNEARSEVMKLAPWAREIYAEKDDYSSALEVFERLKKLYARDDSWFEVLQNARVALGAARYNSSHRFGGDSWGIRDRHMLSMLSALLDHYGPGSKAIVWCHANHAGNFVRANMGEDGYVNLAGLAYEKYKNTFSVGSGTYEGTVSAGRSWGGAPEAQKVPGAPARSFEKICHEACEERRVDRFLLDFQGLRRGPLSHHRSHRYYAVVYDPDSTPLGHFVKAPLSLWYDAFVFFDKTHALDLL